MLAISLNGVGKVYPKQPFGFKRLWQIASGNTASETEKTEVLCNIDLAIQAGQVVGVIGQNGAGKSTLLKIIAGMLPHSCGSLAINGRVTALLELGSGFHPDLSGRENVYLVAQLAGLSKSDIDKKFQDIVAFSGVADVIDSPFKTYSSGMAVRLAFSLATSIDPEILIIDEALSVGDGLFARKSFNRILDFRDQGKTILFCSHSMYQIETICDQVIWLEKGQLKGIGKPADMVVAYNTFLSLCEKKANSNNKGTADINHLSSQTEQAAPTGTAEIVKVKVSSDGYDGKEVIVQSRKSTVMVSIDFLVDPQLPVPSVAIIIDNMAGEPVLSAGTANEKIALKISEKGYGSATISFEKFALLKGMYWVSVFLMSEDGIHLYQDVKMAAKLVVEQADLEVGLVSLAHQWHINS